MSFAVIGATVERTHAHDLHATILHLLGIDHARLTYRSERRTDVADQVIRKALA